MAGTPPLCCPALQGIHTGSYLERKVGAPQPLQDPTLAKESAHYQPSGFTFVSAVSLLQMGRWGREKW